MKSKCIFLDRDGVLNEDNPNYTFRPEKFIILPGVIEGLKMFRTSGYRLIVITNQSGIAQGLYTIADMKACHDYLQKASNTAIDHFYFCPYHPTVTASLARKPATLMFEKAIARFNVDVSQSWMIGDRTRDIIPARMLGLRTIQIGDEVEPEHLAEFKVNDLVEAARLILNK